MRASCSTASAASSAPSGQVDNIDFLSKNSASQPAPKDLIEKVAANYRGALLAIAD